MAFEGKGAREGKTGFLYVHCKDGNTKVAREFGIRVYGF